MLRGCSKGSSQDHNLRCNHNDEALIQSPDVLLSVMKESHHPGRGLAPDSSVRILYRDRKKPVMLGKLSAVSLFYSFSRNSISQTSLATKLKHC